MGFGSSNYISGPRLSLRASAHRCDWALAQLYRLWGCFAPINGSQLPQLWASAHLYVWASAPLVGFGSSIGLGLGSACTSDGLRCSNRGLPPPSTMGFRSSIFLGLGSACGLRLINMIGRRLSLSHLPAGLPCAQASSHKCELRAQGLIFNI